MAYVGHPIKAFQFIIEIDGLEQFEAQTVEVADVEIEATEHGDTNYSVKTPGRVTVGDVVIGKLKPMPSTDLWAWNWLMAAQNPMTGGGALAMDVKQLVTIREMDSTGTIVVNTTYYHGAWVKGISHSGHDRMSSDNIIESITLSVDQVQKM